MDLIKRYVYAVTRSLPEKQRLDVARELRSDIEAMVMDRAAGKKVTEQHARAVLVELGDPAVFAYQYQEPKKYLIGPLFFDTYLALLKTLLFIVPAIVAIITLIGSLYESLAFEKILVNTVGAAVEVAVHVAFWTTLIFIVVDRSGNTKAQLVGRDVMSSAWSPDDLPKLPKNRQIPKSETINGIVWSLVATIAVLWQVPAIHMHFGPNVPYFFSEDMWPGWILALLAVTVFSLLGEIVRHSIGTWNKVTVGLITVVNSLVIAYFASLLIFVNSIVNGLYADELVRVTHNASMSYVIEVAVRLALFSLIVFAVYEIGMAWVKYKKQGEE